MQTNDRLITELMTAINNGRIQLPDFSERLGMGRWTNKSVDSKYYK